MKKLLYTIAMALAVVMTACDNDFAYPPVAMGEIKGDGTAADPYNVAKAIRVASANGEESTEFVFTGGYVVTGEIDPSYGNATFDIADSPEGTKTIKLYRIKDFNNQKFTDASKIKVGDYIVVYAPLINFRGNTPETGTGGYLYSINGVVGSDVPDQPSQPSTPGDASGNGTEESPYTVADVQKGATGEAWVKGYIVGWVEGQVLSSGATFNSSATVATNLLIADTPDATDVSKCVPVQLPAGAVRSALNLQDNPGNYKKQVTLLGSLEKYFGTAGVKAVTSYKIDGAGGDTPVTPPAATAKFSKVTAITSGKQYLLVAEGMVATPLTSAYGYIQVKDATFDGDCIMAADSEAFTFTASGNGYAIQAAGKYYYQTGTYNSFNVDESMPADGAVWTVKEDSGEFIITNSATGKSIQFDSQYTSFGCYPDERGTYPMLYEKVD